MRASRTQQRMRDLEHSLRHDISKQNDKQEEKFGSELQRLERNIDNMQRSTTSGGAGMDLKATEDRIAKLELGEKTLQVAEYKENYVHSTTFAQARSSTLTPAHVVFGQWPDNTDRTRIETEALVFVSGLPSDVRRWRGKPFAPKKYGSITEIHVEAHALQACMWACRREIEKSSAAGRGTPWRADVEQCLEAGRTKRAHKDAAARGRSALIGEDFEVERNSSMW